MAPGKGCHSHEELVVLQSGTKLRPCGGPPDHALPAVLPAEPLPKALLRVGQVSARVEDIEGAVGVNEDRTPLPLPPLPRLPMAQLEEEGRGSCLQVPRRLAH